MDQPHWPIWRLNGLSPIHHSPCPRSAHNRSDWTKSNPLRGPNSTNNAGKSRLIRVLAAADQTNFDRHPKNRTSIKIPTTGQAATYSDAPTEAK